MIGKLGSWIREFTEDQAVSPAEDDEWAAAIAGLLIEAAMADGELDDTERAQVARILSAQPGLDSTRVDRLIDEAVASHETRVEIHSLTRAIRAETDPEDREPAVVLIDEHTVGYVEPIFMQPLCVTCHGAELAPDLEAKLDELYPGDQARGYVAGDLRGVFWAELARD